MGRTTLNDIIENPTRLPTKREIVEELGEEGFRAYRLAYKWVKGKERNCGNPKILHSLHPAYRLKEHSLDQRYVVSALLHDHPEEGSSTLSDLAQRLGEVGNEFGEEIRKDVDTLTNLYSIIGKQVAKNLRTMAVDDFEGNMRVISIFLGQLQRNMRGRQLEALFGKKVETLKERVRKTEEEEWNLYATGMNGNRTSEFLKAITYDLYLKKIKEESYRRTKKGESHADLPVIIKLADADDNIRTAPYTVLRDMKKIISKTEAVLDCFRPAQKTMRRHGYREDRIRRFNHKLACELVLCIGEYQRGLEEQDSARWIPLRKYYKKEEARLREKYSYDMKLPETRI